MINDEMNNLLQLTKLNVDVIELDSTNTITDNSKILHDRLKKLNKNINTTTYNEEIVDRLKLIKTKVVLILYNCQNLKTH